MIIQRKPKVLFLNGWGYERDFQEAFIKAYPGRVVTYDYMGNTDKALEDLKKIKADVIIGFSFGGYLAEKLSAPLRILVCPLLSFSKAHADFLGIEYEPLKAESGHGEKTIGIFGELDGKVGKIDQNIFKKKYGKPEIIKGMKHKPPLEFWKSLGSRIKDEI